MSRKLRCPRCGSTELRPVVYGRPDDADLMRLWEKGEVMIRPRQATDGKASGWMCGECGLDRNEARADYDSLPRPL
jgi:hypothetical protein